jgi:Domain of unknown function (DUF4276)
VSRVYVVVEGQTEESFIKNVLAPALSSRQVWLTPILLGKAGGNPTYARLKKDVSALLKQDANAYCSTMLDFYGRGADFPGQPFSPNLSNIEKVRSVERAVMQDIVDTVPNRRADARFLPYLQLHEYEALLFSNPTAFARGIYQPTLADPFDRVRREFATPEDIDDDPARAPSKRITDLCTEYRKPLIGLRAALEVGLEAMRRECLHFNEWVSRLEGLGTDARQA